MFLAPVLVGLLLYMIGTLFGVDRFYSSIENRISLPEFTLPANSDGKQAQPAKKYTDRVAGGGNFGANR